MYGNWSVTDRDISEVLVYRGGIVGSAACTLFVTAALATDVLDLTPQTIDAVCVTGALFFGSSLALIHMYVTDIKRVIQLLFVAGVLGGGVLMATQEGPLPMYVAAHPAATLLVGPAFAAVTGVAIKEGLCYGKLEAAVLAAVRFLMCEVIFRKISWIAVQTITSKEALTWIWIRSWSHGCQEFAAGLSNLCPLFSCLNDASF
jgi:uncharacterized integral membrane protein